MHVLILIVSLLTFLTGVYPIMAAIDDLTAAVAKLSTDVDALIAAKAAGVPVAAVEAQTQAVQAIDAKVVAATS